VDRRDAFQTVSQEENKQAAQPEQRDEGKARAPEHSHQWKNLATALDGAIRGVSAGGSPSPSVLERVVELWKAVAGLPVTLSATKLVVGGQTVLETSDKEGRWLLPAYAAGVRSLCGGAGLSAERVRSLVEQLGGADLSADGVDALHGWLWAGGAVGIEVDLVAPWTEQVDRVAPPDPGPWLRRAATQLEQSWAGAPAVSPGLNLTAIAEAQQAVVDELSADLYDDAFALGDMLRDELRERCDESEPWDSMMAEAVLRYEALQGAMAPAAVAEMLLERLSEGADAALLETLARITGAGDQHSRQVLAVMLEADLGRSLADGLDASDDSVLQPVARLVTHVPPTVARPLFHRLLERAGRQQAVFRLLSNLVQSVGLVWLRKHIDEARLSDQAAQAYVRIVLQRKATMDLLTSVLDSVSESARVAIIAALPKPIVLKMEAYLRKLLVEASPGAASRLIKAITALNHPEAARWLAETMYLGEGKGWSTIDLQHVCDSVVAQGLGEGFLVPLVRTRSSGSELRLVALRSLFRDPDLLEKAVARRAGELVDPPEVKKALAKAREHLARVK